MGRPEDERVKIPALVHLTRLDYDYVSLKKGIAYDGDTNIFVDVFRVAINRINGLSLTEAETQAIVRDFSSMLGADDLGRQFYQHLLRGYQGIRLIDFEHPTQNTYQFATELPCINGHEEFRPDITKQKRRAAAEFCFCSSPFSILYRHSPGRDHCLCQMS